MRQRRSRASLSRDALQMMPCTLLSVAWGLLEMLIPWVLTPKLWPWGGREAELRVKGHLESPQEGASRKCRKAGNKTLFAFHKRNITVSCWVTSGFLSEETFTFKCVGCFSLLGRSLNLQNASSLYR